MRILLTNDDGFNSEGIIVLEEVLCSYGHQVSVCAPTHQQSAKSHAMTLTEELEITSYAPYHYHCKGTPSDCLLYTFRGGIFNLDDFDLVISGINRGLNISSDILYSGTLAAASEAVILGMKAMAISCASSKVFGHKDCHDFSYKEAAIFLAEHLDQFIPLCTSNSIVSINVPFEPTNNWKAAYLGKLNYQDAAYVKKGSLDSLNVSGSSLSLCLKDPDKAPDFTKNHDKLTDYEALVDQNIAVSVVEVLPTISPLQQELINLEGRF